ncbi:MAG TPA: hypothetical protein VJB59_09445 [Bdellovibrionota bacterium]|nr:hypothetical protein [Bdellovibrionota bacterium]
MSQKFVFFLFFLLTIVNGIFVSVLPAAELAPVFEQLKQSAVSYENNGAICEQVTRLKLQERFPERGFRVETGIVYGEDRRTIGELDVVVFRKSDDQAILIAEVKCWKNLRSAIKKAHDQRARFQGVIQQGLPVDFRSAKDRFDLNQFSGSPEFIAVSQKGGESAGFDMGLDFTLEELMTLRSWLLRCQANRECASE